MKEAIRLTIVVFILCSATSMEAGIEKPLDQLTIDIPSLNSETECGNQVACVVTYMTYSVIRDDDVI